MLMWEEHESLLEQYNSNIIGNLLSPLQGLNWNSAKTHAQRSRKRVEAGVSLAKSDQSLPFEMIFSSKSNSVIQKRQCIAINWFIVTSLTIILFQLTFDVLKVLPAKLGFPVTAPSSISKPWRHFLCSTCHKKGRKCPRRDSKWNFSSSYKLFKARYASI